MPDLLLNGKPEQEFPDEEMDFLEIARGMTTATDRLRVRSEVMQYKFGILTTRLAASEAATTHLKNQLEIVRSENQLLNERLTTLEQRTPPSKSDMHSLFNNHDLLAQKVAQLSWEVRQARPWYVRLAEWWSDRYGQMDDR